MDKILYVIEDKAGDIYSSYTTDLEWTERLLVIEQKCIDLHHGGKVTLELKKYRLVEVKDESCTT